MNNMWHNYNWTAVNFRALTVSIYQGHIWWISCLRSKHLQMQNAKIHLTFNLKASSAWKKCTGCSSARYGKDQIQIECFKVCGLQTFTYFFGISMKLTFLMQAPCLNRKYRKNCEYCPGHSLIVQSLTLYVRKMGRLQLETQTFILSILESSDETRFCVSHEGIPIGLGRLYLREGIQKKIDFF